MSKHGRDAALAHAVDAAAVALLSSLKLARTYVTGAEDAEAIDDTLALAIPILKKAKLLPVQP